MRPPRLRETATIPSQMRSASGFTLLELMVVIVVIGVLVSIFTLSMGSINEDENLEHARRLDTLLSLSLEEAGIQGRELGLNFYQSGYEFSVQQRVENDAGESAWVWVPLDNDPLLKPRDFGEDIRVDLEIEDKEVVLEFERSEDNFNPGKDAEDDDATSDAKRGYQPQIFLLSSGDIEPPFRARIRGAFTSKGIVISVAADGSSEIIPDEY